MNRGFITIQFLIAFLIVMFFVLSFLGLSLTLTHATLVQYITYSSARKLSLGDRDINIQRSEAEQKYASLRETFFKSNYKEGGTDWFSIPMTPTLGFNTSYDEDSSGYYRNMFYGVYVPFVSRIFNFQFPLITNSEKRNLETEVASYLGREPSENECLYFFDNLKNKVCNFYGGVVQACGSLKVESNNGC